MKLKEMTQLELEALSYTDLTYIILSEENKPMNTPSIFKEICSLLGYSDKEYTAKIGDFYTSLTTDKRFILLDTAEWDLKAKHVVKIELDEEEEVEEEEEEEEVDEEESIDVVIEADDLDDVDDDIEDLSIVDEDEIEANE